MNKGESISLSVESLYWILFLREKKCVNPAFSDLTQNQNEAIKKLICYLWVYYYAWLILPLFPFSLSYVFFALILRKAFSEVLDIEL